MAEIKFHLEKPSAVKIIIRNQFGRVIEEIDRTLSEGEQIIEWKPKAQFLGNMFRYEVEAGGKEIKNGMIAARAEPS